MNDPQIRSVLISNLKKEFPLSKNNLIVNEMNVCKGIARIDVAVVNGSLHGYEIKSSEDTLYRLDSQLSFYYECFDYLYIVTTEKHLEKILSFYPDFIGIYEAINKNGYITINERRKARINNNTKTESIIDFLWKDEMIALAKSKCDKNLSYKSKNFISDYIINNFAADEIKKFVRDQMKSRKDWKLGQEQEKNDGCFQFASM